MLVNDTEFLWVERYRPKRVADCILPATLKDIFLKYVEQKNIPNIILNGGSGVGKTTIARAMLEELGHDYILINSSLYGNIDTLRNEISIFASTMSLDGARKYVILDEADYLNPNSTQPALRNFMETFSQNCGFIFTCNHKNRIIKELHSRCAVIDFVVAPSEQPALAAEFMKRVEAILKNEKIQYELKVVAEVIMKYFPDWRRVLNELQSYSVRGKIDSGILTASVDKNVETLFKFLKEKSFTNMRKWVSENTDLDTTSLYAAIYQHASTHLKAESVPQLIIILAEYQYKEAFVANKEINLVACLTELMVQCEFV